MSRVAKKPIAVPKGVDCQIKPDAITVKGPKGILALKVPAGVDVVIEGGEIKLNAKNPADMKMAGTARALIQNMVKGVSEGYSRKLELVGVGYRAALHGKDLNLTLGFSHPVHVQAPAGVTFEVPQPTRVTVRGFDKQLVGQVAADIRKLRKPEPYKGKGIRYVDEKVTIKETKKK